MASISTASCSSAAGPGEVRNVSLLVAIGVNGEGYREILGVCEGAKGDKAGWSGFLKHLKERGLRGVQLIISDSCMGLSESAAKFFPDAAWQCCIVGPLKKPDATDSIVVDDSNQGSRYARAQESRSAGVIHLWVVAAVDSGRTHSGAG